MLKKEGMIQMEINSKIIKLKIIEKGYTNREIANKLNIHEQTISNWINGKMGNIEKFIELCKILDIDINEF